jgi:hypothetical protein
MPPHDDNAHGRIRSMPQPPLNRLNKLEKTARADDEFIHIRWRRPDEE